ncbi:MAG: hypothetical protein M1324_02260 [Patescibacteria group bacterium]|nr:hypothetical protein [Patescibacteria group bacterium]
MTELEIALFEGRKIRRKWDEKKGRWFFSVVDVVEILTESKDARKYWNKLAERLRKEGSEVVTKCHRLKLKAADDKMRITDVADTETMLRIIQSIPSKNAEPFKLWLAKVGYERIQEIQDPEKSLNRARQNWQNLGQSGKWIQQRMMGQETRNKLTDYWKNNGIEEQNEFAILTNVIHQEWSGLTVGRHKKLKGLKNHNLRDHMSEAELIFTALAELSTRQIAETDEAVGFLPNKKAGVKGGGIAKRARQELESETGKKVITNENFLTSEEGYKKIRP